MSQPNVNPTSFTSYDEQTQSSLFAVLPPEIRYEIFSQALTSTPDFTETFDQEGYSTRPGYETRHRTWTELLRTCKKVYREAWFMPFMGSEHAFYLAWTTRSPRRQMTVQKMQQYLDLIYQRHGDIHGGRIRIFAQQCELHAPFKGIFKMQHFHPTSVTVTLRYTDTWNWESDRALDIGASWCKDMILPASVTSFTLDVESLERRSYEVDWVSQQAMEKWHFARDDGVLLFSCPEDIAISHWTGSSVLGQERWIRDEEQERPGKLSYYVGSITWRPSKESLNDRPVQNPGLRYQGDRVRPAQRAYNHIDWRNLEVANISLDIPPDEVCELYLRWMEVGEPIDDEEEDLREDSDRGVDNDGHSDDYSEDGEGSEYEPSGDDMD
ncbi:uncharacterized protein N7482_000107 [Penicillium canariense]|uniref:Uncharacterized protein n=1 Tax=Penicillium canariense TaxID=189055 RepID=A0A9W9LSC1_9EURO|nr:uncharacterized protein N7482_000107 [Penicillium canariense]KAJ5174230.1 hypothetical protein N7482_000107 [Penicillium canariense]